MAHSSFAKHPRLSRVDHAVLFLFLLGASYLSSVAWHPAPFWVLLSALGAGYALFWFAVGHRIVKGRIYQSAIAHFPKKYGENGSVIAQEPRISRIYKKPIDFKGYISDRNNRNLFISGRSGSGKSTLMRYVIELFPESSKTIFSFKSGDEYLKLGMPILRIAEHAGYPFSDREAFVQSFLVTYPISSQGVVAASVPNLLRTVLKGSGSWRSLRSEIELALAREKSASVTRSALSFIQQKLADLELASRPCPLPTGDVVLDFSGLNESAKTFYAELHLRQTWHSIEDGSPDPMRHIIIIDEAHRLLKSEATIFGEVARLIRARGALWCGTQNYSDLPDYVRNQFAMHLLFSTKSERDLRALKEINALLPFTATELRDHHFTDAAMRELHEAIPIYTADIAGFQDRPEVYIKPEISENAPIEAKPKPMLDYRDRVLKMLENEASWPSKLAKEIAAQDGMGGDVPKLAVTRALKALREDGMIEKQLLMVEDREVSLYYRKDPAMSGLHRFMEKEVTKKLEKDGIAYELAKPGEDKPDIMTKDFDIEIETGLKHDIKEVERRLVSATKKTYVIVPTEVEMKRYNKAIDEAELQTNIYLVGYNSLKTLSP